MKCKICLEPANGNHFGVISCRACAAFFRRGSKNLYKYKCSTGFGGCKIFENDKYQCKKCRLEKCKNEGMNEKKFQYDRDSHQNFLPISRIKRKFPFLSDQSSIYLSVNTSDTYPGKTFIDLKYLLEHANGILNKTPKKTIFSTSTLHKITKAITLSRQLPTFTNTQKITSYGRTQRLIEWENSFLLVAHWLTYFDAFLELDPPLKLEILKTIWHIWIQIDRLFINAVARKRGLCTEKSIMFGYHWVVEFEDLHFDIEWFTDYKKEDMGFYLDQIDWNLYNLIPGMISLAPSDLELTYMTLQLCFNYAGKRLQNKALQVCDGFLDVLSNDLHQYYKEIGVRNYSGRLAVLMKMNQRIEKDIIEKRWKYEVGKVFNVWKIEFSHPEVFEDNSC